MLVLDTPDQIAAFRVATLRIALKSEIRGLRMTRGRTAYAILKSQYGLRGSRESVLAQLDAMRLG